MLSIALKIINEHLGRHDDRIREMEKRITELEQEVKSLNKFITNVFIETDE